MCAAAIRSPVMYTPGERAALRAALVAAASADDRFSGIALAGSAAVGRQDDWSDIDLVFGLGETARLPGAVADWTASMYGEHGAVHHVDIVSGASVYRAFLLASTLQVDLTFAPAGEFGATGPKFRLLAGRSVERPVPAQPGAGELIGMGWLYAQQARVAACAPLCRRPAGARGSAGRPRASRRPHRHRAAVG